jgi:hypothetical protein
MNANDQIRSALREADPAAGRELSPAARARMRASLMSEALAGRRHGPGSPSA